MPIEIIHLCLHGRKTSALGVSNDQLERLPARPFSMGFFSTGSAAMSNMDKTHSYTCTTSLHSIREVSGPVFTTPKTVLHHRSGEGPLGGGNASSSYPFSDLSEGGGVGRLSAESSVAMRKASAQLLQGKGGGLPNLRWIGFACIGT